MTTVPKKQAKAWTFNPVCFNVGYLYTLEGLMTSKIFTAAAASGSEPHLVVVNDLAVIRQKFNARQVG